MKRNRIMFCIQICIGILLGIGMLNQIDFGEKNYCEKIIRMEQAAKIEKYVDCTIKDYDVSEIFLRVDRQYGNEKIAKQELLAKSKRDKFIVTREK